MSDITVHLVRHGQSTWNREGRLQGQTDNVPLTDQGMREAHSAAQLLSRQIQGEAVLWSSDLLRARATAQIIGRTLGLEVNVDPALREMALGRFEGQLSSEVQLQMLPGETHPNDVRWPGGESLRDVFDRVVNLFKRVLPNAPGHVVVVTHGDTLRVASAVLRGHGYREIEMQVPANGSVQSMLLKSGFEPGLRTD